MLSCSWLAAARVERAGAVASAAATSATVAAGGSSSAEEFAIHGDPRRPAGRH